MNRSTRANDLDAKSQVKLAKSAEKILVQVSPRFNQISETPGSKQDSSKYYGSETFNSSSVIGSFFSTIEKNKNDLINIQNNPYYYEDFCEENLKGSLNFFELLFKLTKKIMIYLKKATVEKRSPYIQLILARKPTRLKDIAQTMMFRNI